METLAGLPAPPNISPVDIESRKQSIITMLESVNLLRHSCLLAFRSFVLFFLCTFMFTICPYALLEFPGKKGKKGKKEDF
jgi:hypothetical protein